LHGFAGIINLSVGVTATAEADTDSLHRALSGAGYHSVETRGKSDTVFAVATEAWARGGRGTAALTNDGEQLAAFIGRLDNAGELASTLGQPLDSDAGALVAGAHRRWPEEAPARLLGDFAYAVWDARERTLCLTRDIGGWHALYYLLRADRIVFAD
jgi:asparagine synthase (glutamine-hydrolysing)